MNLQEVCIMPFTPTPALPDPFLGPDGKRITSPDAWPQQARYIRDLCEEHLYGTWPDAPKSVEERLRASTDYRGTAVRLTGHLVIDGRYALPVCYIYPSGKGPFPIITFNTTRLGMQSPLEQEIIDSGYGIFSFDRECIRPDPGMEAAFGYKNETRDFPSLPCGDIMAWAWGHRIAADWLRARPEAGPLICTGHSRGGKAALCAGIFDDRFEVTAPMGSGCGGAGCARFSGTLALDRDDPAKCETIGRMAHVFPTWMTPRYASYGSDSAPYPIGTEVQSFPLDAHMLRAACAPRAVFDSEGRSDFWANSFGTELCRDAAQKVFEFLGVPERNGFHIRNGGHAFNRDDWSALIDFCDIVLHRVRSMPRSDTTNSAYVIDLKKYAPWAED